MSVSAILKQHSQISRNVHANRTPSFVVRSPALINLPIPLPSVPLLTPLLSPVIAGKQQPPAVTTAPTVPSPTPTSGGNGDGNGGNGGDGGSGNGGNNGNGNGSGENNGNNGGGNSNNGGTGDGTNTTNTSSNPSGTTGNSQPGSTGTSGGQVSDSFPTGTATGIPTTGSHSSVTPGNFVDNNDGKLHDEASEGVNHSTRTGAPSATNDASTRNPAATVSFTDSGGVGGTSPSGTPGTGTGIENTAAHSSGISGGAVAGIIIAILVFLLTLLVIFMRRRAKARRSERRQRWWFTRRRNSKIYDDEKANGGENENGLRSARSSFATTIDHSQTPQLTLTFDTPPMPPMAELRGSPAFVSLNSPEERHISPLATEQSRFSVGTISSLGADDQGQWLIVNRDQESNPEVRTPMSVRPFSPTESFAFPKPPDRSSHSLSRPVSTSTIHSGNKNSSTFDVPPTPAIPAAVANPFNDPEPLMVNVKSPLLIVPPPNPFVDPTSEEPPSPSPVHPEFMEVELVRRPFVPTLSDEMSVSIGEKVKIIEMFDDGWAMVEKNPSPVDIKGKGRAQDVKVPEKGLIPVDCLRDPGVDVTNFINTKRLSSYSQKTVIYQTP